MVKMDTYALSYRERSSRSYSLGARHIQFNSSLNRPKEEEQEIKKELKHDESKDDESKESAAPADAQDPSKESSPETPSQETETNA